MSETALPAWAREETFLIKPESGRYGCQDAKGKSIPFDDLDGLKDHLAKGKGKLAWVWVPGHDRLVAPEEVPSLANSLKKRRALFAAYDADDARKGFLIFGAALAWTGYAAVSSGGFAALGRSQNFGLAALMFLIFALRPWWEARKGRKELAEFSAENIEAEIPEARFELWLGSQKSRLTLAMLALVTAAGGVQMLVDGKGIAAAGLVKPLYHAGETWRIFTAAFLHGNLIHFAMNASALWYLARRVEILARWPHLAAVFFLSIIGAGWATVTWLPAQTSVGVSGVVCGLLSFLLVFETLHQPLVPRSARRRLLGILVSLVVIGTLGFKFIDNAAHFGGLVAGACYGVIVFPKSASPHRPIILRRDLILGGVSLLLIGLSGVGAILAMISH
ncbi:MAG: rhomboid family intramembrane serine protease [Akkermansiaceae bacterium]|jgi:membrane associated rhomboid family serine protease